MTYTISKDFTFSASHRISGLPMGHPCSRLHGHNYTVRVQLQADTLDGLGMVCDYAVLDPFGDHLAAHYDHRHLNDDMPQRRQPPMGKLNPTAENLADLLAEAVAKVCYLPAHVTLAVGVSETTKTWAWSQ